MRKEIISKIIELLSVKKIVTTMDLIAMNEKVSSEVILDARSAAFYALGQALKKKEKVILLIKGEELTSVYTAITEAWFQKAEIIILAEYSSYKDVKCGYLKRCTKAIYNIEDVSDIQIHDKSYGPILLNYIEQEREEQIDYNEFGDVLEKLKTDKVIVYHGNLRTDIKTQYVDKKYKYGLLSKYVGYINSVDENIVLLCSVENVLTDLNVFNTRYMKETFKVLVVDEKGKLENKNIDKWIISNGIEYVDNLQKININKPTVYVKKGK